jgi:hypothetical protein
MRKIYQLLLVITFLFFGCGKGIEPEPEKDVEGFGGKVTFTGQWSPDVTRTHIVAFKQPLNSAADFNILNLAYVSLEIPYGVNEFFYSTPDSAIFPINTKVPAGTYSYIAVAQQVSDSLSLSRADWFVVGVYYGSDSTSPGIVTVEPGEYRDNINIHVDFNSPPPQPPGNEQ